MHKVPKSILLFFALAVAARRVGLGPGGDAPFRDARVASAVAGAVERADDIGESAAVDTEVVESPCVGMRRVGLGVVCVWVQIKIVCVCLGGREGKRRPRRETKVRRAQLKQQQQKKWKGEKGDAREER